MWLWNVAAGSYARYQARYQARCVDCQYHTTRAALGEVNLAEFIVGFFVR